MSEEDKMLLFTDLCGRLPYDTVIEVHGEYEDHEKYARIMTLETNNINDIFDPEKTVIVYLRPISSMTEEEIDKLFNILHIDKNGKDEDWIKINDDLGIKFFFPTGKWIENIIEVYDYLNSIHVDYRGLIAKKLAFEAPDDIYV